MNEPNESQINAAPSAGNPNHPSQPPSDCQPDDYRKWAIESTHDDIALVMLGRNRHTLDLATLLTPPSLDAGFEEHFRKNGAKLGLSRWQVEKYTMIGWSLRNLRAVVSFLSDRPVLNFDHLRHIADTVYPIDENEEPELIAEIDAELAKWLEPRIDNQSLPTPRALLNHLKRMMETLAPQFRPNDPREKAEQAAKKREGEYHVDERDEDTSTFNFTLTKADAETVSTAVNKVAARDGVSKAQALLSLIDGSAAISTTLHLYANADIPLIWADRIGWLTPHLAQPLLDQLMSITLESDTPPPTDSYAPTAEQARYVRARDAVCRAPGCEVPAHKCEIDHIIPFDAGGTTSVDNLHCLCPQHHQLKTNRYAHLIMGFSGVQAWTDNETGEVVYTVPQGPLAKQYPMMTFGNMRAAQAERIQAHNQRREEWLAEQAAAQEEDVAQRDAEFKAEFEAARRAAQEEEPPF